MVRALGVNDSTMIALTTSPTACGFSALLAQYRDLPTSEWASAWLCGDWRASSSAKRWSAATGGTDARRRRDGLGSLPLDGRGRAALGTQSQT